MRRATTAPLVPSPPLLGSSFELLADPYRFWVRQYQQHGPVYRVRLPIEGRIWIALAGRDANAFLAREGHRLFSQAMTYPRAREVLGTSLHPSITEGELQLHLKRQIAPGFSRHAASAHVPAMARFARDYVRGWLPGKRFNVVSEMARLGLNCVSILATGRELGHDTDGFARYATVFTGVVAMSWPRAIMALPFVRDAKDGLDALIAERLREHAAAPPRGQRLPDYFDLVLAGTLPDGAPLPERVRVVFGQIPFKNMGVYAGRVMNQVLYQAVRRPEVLAAIEPEIDDVFSGTPTASDLASMEALRGTIKETLRLLPIAVAVQRTVAEPFELAGYRFEVGDRLFFPISVPHFPRGVCPRARALRHRALLARAARTRARSRWRTSAPAALRFTWRHCARPIVSARSACSRARRAPRPCARGAAARGRWCSRATPSRSSARARAPAPISPPSPPSASPRARPRAGSPADGLLERVREARQRRAALPHRGRVRALERARAIARAAAVIDLVTADLRERRLGDAPHRRARPFLRGGEERARQPLEARAAQLRDVGVDRPRVHQVGGDPAPAEPQRELARPQGEERLAGVIRRPAPQPIGVAALLRVELRGAGLRRARREGSVEEEPGARRTAERGQEVVRELEGRQQVHGELRLDAVLGGGAPPRHHGGVVHDGLDLRVLGHEARGERAHLPLRRQVCRHQLRAPSARADVPQRRRPTPFVTAHHDDGRPARRDLRRRSEADPRARPRDDDHRPLQATHRHRCAAAASAVALSAAQRV
jgi:cytochrome P450